MPAAWYLYLSASTACRSTTRYVAEQLMNPILDVRNLSIDYLANGTPLHAVEDINFQIQKGSSLALVGESGCGKTPPCSRCEITSGRRPHCVG